MKKKKEPETAHQAFDRFWKKKYSAVFDRRIRDHWEIEAVFFEGVEAGYNVGKRASK